MVADLEYSTLHGFWDAGVWLWDSKIWDHILGIMQDR